MAFTQFLSFYFSARGCTYIGSWSKVLADRGLDVPLSINCTKNNKNDAGKNVYSLKNIQSLKVAQKSFMHNTKIKMHEWYIIFQ